ncbi:1,4-dihydroxy-2-naphthoyl-CoA hydrolase [bacterium HR29]|jgi:thioesterase-3|nr:1,4-dihydroxy-2-naphthoyl-CoA hydrolase [bacterium HR29]
MIQQATETEIAVRSTDVDSDGHVNNARYYEYCEQGRLAHLARLGIIRREPRHVPYHGLFTIVETRCRYLLPLYYGDRVVVRTTTVAVGRSSFRLRYELLRGGEKVAEGESVQVWLGEDGRSAPLPEPVRETLVLSLAEPPADAPAAEPEEQG